MPRLKKRYLGASDSRDEKPGQPSVARGHHTAQVTSLRALAGLVREDWVTAHRSWSRPGLHALLVYRAGRWVQTLPPAARRVGLVVYMVLYNVVRSVHAIQLPLTADIGRRVLLSHCGHVFVGDYVRIGDDCLIRHNVTIGGRDRGRSREAPTLESGVRVGVGAVVTGAITVGASAKIGPNAVVYTDIPQGATVIAPPSEVRPRKTRRDPVSIREIPTLPADGGQTTVA